MCTEDDSPYPEVRSAVANTDDPDMPVVTIRSWAIGLLWAIIVPGLNQFFFFRYPSVTITGVRSNLLKYLSHSYRTKIDRGTIVVVPLGSSLGEIHA